MVWLSGPSAFSDSIRERLKITPSGRPWADFALSAIRIRLTSGLEDRLPVRKHFFATYSTRSLGRDVFAEPGPGALGGHMASAIT